MKGILRVPPQPRPLARIWGGLLPGWQSQATVRRRADGNPGSQETSPSHVSGLLSHIPTSLLTAWKFLPVLSTHGAFIHSPYTSLLLSGTLFPCKSPLSHSFHRSHTGGQFFQEAPHHRPPPIWVRPPTPLYFQGHPALSSALTPGGSRSPAPCRALQRAEPKSTVLSPRAHTPRRALSAFSISTCQMNECITRTNKSHS